MKLLCFWALLLSLIAPPLIPFPASPQQVDQQVIGGSIAGVVIDAGTREPISDAQVRGLMVSGGAPGAGRGGAASMLSGGVTDSLDASLSHTDSTGRFELKDLKAGTYRFAVAANGYAGQQSPVDVHISPGDRMRDLVISLIPAGAVSGRISDGFGKPVVDMHVELARFVYDSEGRKTYRLIGSTRTNDRGEYRFFWVSPGAYYINAGSPMDGLPDGGRNTPNGVQQHYGLMYYPGTTDTTNAILINVKPGAESGGINFVLPRLDRTYNIRGKIIDSLLGRPPVAANISVLPMSRVQTAVSYANAKYNGSDGSFEVTGLVPGAYVIGGRLQELAQNPSEGRRSRIASVQVDVRNSDVNGVSLAMVAPASIPGRLIIEGQDIATVPGIDRLRVQLRSFLDLGPFQPTVRAQVVNADGTFRHDDVLPGQYRVVLNGLPEGFYMKEARFDRQDVLSRPLVLEGTMPSLLEIVLGSKGGTVEGPVVNDRQQLVPGARVVLIPEEGRNRIDLYRAVTSDEFGYFSFRGVAPGNYALFAWEALEPFAYFDPQWVREFESRATRLRVVETEHRRIEVKSIPSETVSLFSK